MQTIPLQPTANQTFQVQLGGQACQLNVYQFAYGLFVDVYAGGQLIQAGVIAQNTRRIVRSLYLGFVGDLAFYDTQGTSDPVYTGLGSRFLLLYLTPADLG